MYKKLCPYILIFSKNFSLLWQSDQIEQFDKMFKWLIFVFFFLWKSKYKKKIVA